MPKKKGSQRSKSVCNTTLGSQIVRNPSFEERHNRWELIFKDKGHLRHCLKQCKTFLRFPVHKFKAYQNPEIRVIFKWSNAQSASQIHTSIMDPEVKIRATKYKCRPNAILNLSDLLEEEDVAKSDYSVLRGDKDDEPKFHHSISKFKYHHHDNSSEDLPTMKKLKIENFLNLSSAFSSDDQIPSAPAVNESASFSDELHLFTKEFGKDEMNPKRFDKLNNEQSSRHLSLSFLKSDNDYLEEWTQALEKGVDISYIEYLAKKACKSFLYWENADSLCKIAVKLHNINYYEKLDSIYIKKLQEGLTFKELLQQSDSDERLYLMRNKERFLDHKSSE